MTWAGRIKWKRSFLAIVLWMGISIAITVSINPAKSNVIQILHNRNPHTNPCDNFYQHACGNYLANIEKSEKDHSITYQSLKKLIEEGIRSDFKPFKLIDDLYKTCMDKATVGQQSLDLMKAIIEKLGGWPLLKDSQWKESEFDIVDFAIKSRELGVFSPLLELATEAIPNDTQLIVITGLIVLRGNDKLKITQSSNVTTEIRTMTVDYLKRLTALLGIKGDVSDLEDIAKLDQQLTQIDVSGGKMVTTDDLSKEIPEINWKKYIDNIVVPNLNTPTKASQILLWRNNEFANQIKLFVKTPKRILANYALWKIIQLNIQYLPEEYRALKREYYEDRKFDDSHSYNCIEVIKQYLPAAINLLYAKNHYNRSVDPIVIDIINNVKNELVNLVNESTWISQDSKKKDIKLIEDTSIVIGYEARDKSDEEIVKFYESLEIDTSNYFRTFLNLQIFYYKNQFNNVTSLGPQDLMVSIDLDRPVNVFGRLYVPLAALHEPFLNINDPMSITYGRFGLSIARELSKVIYKAERDSSSEVLSCFENQYANYSDITNHYSLTSDDEIAKYMQFKLSYLAYQRWVQTNNKVFEPTVSELPYTNNQLFWMSSLQQFCEDLSNETKTINKTFASIEFMLLKYLTNTKQFFDDFQCPDDEVKFTVIYGKPCHYL